MNNTISHLVFLTPGFAEDEQDSTTIPSLQVFLKSLQNTGVFDKMTIISFQFPFTKENYNWNGIEVVPLGGKNQRIKKLLTWKKALSVLKRIHQNHPITIIQSFWIGECSFIGQKFSKKHNIKHIVTVMGQDTNPGNRYAKYLKNHKTTIISLSKSNQKKLLENHHLTSKVIPWSINTAEFPPIQYSTIDILGVGSLTTIKNYSLFVKIISELVLLIPLLKVEIVGEGSQYHSLKKLIKQSHLENNVTITGKIPHKEVLSKMAKSVILLHTSSFESFGQVFIEALYSGMSIVSFSVGIATPIDSWNICATNKEMVQACYTLLCKKEKKKKRILLHPEDTTVNSYLKIFNE